jgi:squalene-hopene/tetraprenyl-beta-curcumene cyclase
MKHRKLAFLGGGLVALAGAAGLLYLTQTSHHSAATRTPEAIARSGDPTLDAIRRAIAYLETRQEADGEFSAGLLDPKPAFTALVVDAVARSPEAKTAMARPFFARAWRAILMHQQEDGGIYTKNLGLDGYCTAISLMALVRVGDPSLATPIERARAYLASCQVDADGNYKGGFGYSKGASKADLSNTVLALEALKETGLKKDDPICQRVQGFLDACHNDSESNKAAWATSDGGFIYRPGESKAGSYTDDAGAKRFRSYGLMSYAGLLSFLTAYVDHQDPRVQSSWKWVRSNWDLENNRNLGPRGLYYYYLTMAKALAAWGEREVVTADGVKHDWPVELAQAIVARQRADGSWKNDDRTWLETDEVLVTAYMLRALSVCRDATAAGTSDVAPVSSK